MTHSASKGSLPEGVNVAKVDYDDEESVVSALRGQDALIITLAVTAPPDLHGKIVKAGAKAGIHYIIPNVYGFDVQNMPKDDAYTAVTLQRLKEVTDAGAAYIAMTCGFWYTWSLALGDQWFGFDIKNKSVTFYDDGKTKINSSTWEQCGRAFGSLFSFPESGASPSVSDWKNEAVRISSFRISQRDMLDSLHRVLGTTDQDWQISYQSTEQRYKDGKAEMEKGIRTGHAKAMYARAFFPDGTGDFESKRELDNEVLNLPKEDLDEQTKVAVEMVESGWKPF